MITIDSLTEEDIGKWVVYTASHGAQEKGRLKSWNDQWIFVVYKTGGEWYHFKDCTGQATKPEDLEWKDSNDEKNQSSQA